MSDTEGMPQPAPVHDQQPPPIPEAVIRLLGQKEVQLLSMGAELNGAFARIEQLERELAEHRAAPSIGEPPSSE